VTPDDLENRRIRYCSAEFAKFYASAISMKKPFFHIVSSQQILLVPKGASLPGMYGRAAVMASGYLPKPDTSGRYLIYDRISIEFAELLAARLGGSDFDRATVRTTILGDEILEAYLKYYDTQYWLRDPELLKRATRVIDQDR
jgi:hypothetical protein